MYSSSSQRRKSSRRHRSEQNGRAVAARQSNALPHSGQRIDPMMQERLSDQADSRKLRRRDFSRDPPLAGLP